MRKCAGAGHPPGPCDNARQLHHIVKQQAIRMTWATLNAAHLRGGPRPWSLRKALDDPRNRAVWTCWRHHKPIEEGTIPVELPDGFWDFIAEYRLTPVLPRWLMERSGQASLEI